MPENKNNSTSSNAEAFEKRMKALEKDVKDIKKLSIANLYGKYDEDIHAEVASDLKEGTLSGSQGLLSKYFHMIFLVFSFLILVFTFLTFAAVTGKGLDMLAKAGIKIEPISVASGTIPNPDQPNPNEPKFAKTSIDDDAVLGDPNAPVTIVEFSDYDCPFCRIFHQTSYADIKKNYIDTGKVKFVYRDLPIRSLHPTAFEKALAVNCARDQGGDTMYYKYHDEVFGRAEKMQASLTKDDLKKVAVDLGLNAGQFNECLDSGKYVDEVNNDVEDASDIAVSATPTFIIGKSNSDGTVDGKIIPGALPYEQFESVINEYLN